MLSNKTYDVLNNIAKYILPLLSNFLLSINNKVHFADNELISLIIIEVITFINGLLGISSLWYYKEKGAEADVVKTKVFASLPLLTSKYFIMSDREGTREGFGGYSPCIEGDVQLYKGCTLNNCVGGAWGLFAMAENNPYCKIGFITSGLFPTGAGGWFNDGKGSKYDTYDRGSQPRVGSVICYSKHVAYVNEIKSNGDLVVWSSAWGSTNPNGFDEVIVKASENYAWRNTNAGVFQGFIYPRV